MGPRELESLTFAMSMQRSNQLSYEPISIGAITPIEAIVTNLLLTDNETLQLLFKRDCHLAIIIRG